MALISWNNLGSIFIALTSGGDVVRKERRPARDVSVAPFGGRGPQLLPAAVFDLDPRALTVDSDKDDLHLGRIGAVAPEVPEVCQSSRWIKDGHFAPLVLDTGVGLLENTATRPR